MRTRSVVLLPLAVFAAWGCSDRPRAPALTNDAVYTDDRAGLKFMVPDGWLMGMRSVPPPGRLEKPAQLVRYHPPAADRAADLELLAIDLPESDDLGKYLAEHQAGGKKWAAVGPPKPVQANGVPATRYEYASAGKTEFRREITAFRRGDRVYLFLTTYGKNDTSSRDQVRLAIESVVWK